MTLVTESFEDFLMKNLKKSFEEQEVRVTDEANFYVFHLLRDFISIERFRTLSGLGSSEQPLALMVKNAFDAPTASEQMWRFVAIGDHSFYISSFLEGHVNRKFKDMTYCRNIGSNSYQQSGRLSGNKSLSKLYRELGLNFTELTSVASAALNKDKIYNNIELLKAYRQYLENGKSELVMELLKKSN